MRIRLMVTVPMVAALSLLGTGLGLSVAASPAAAAALSCSTVDHDVLTVLTVVRDLKPVVVLAAPTLDLLDSPAVTAVLDEEGLGDLGIGPLAVALAAALPPLFVVATSADVADAVGVVVKLAGLCS
jgi:hypothetical protein